jgi:hypothetical protein
MANIGPNHKLNKFLSPVPKSPDHTCLLYVKKTYPRLGHAWAHLIRLNFYIYFYGLFLHFLLNISKITMIDFVLMNLKTFTENSVKM